MSRFQLFARLFQFGGEDADQLGGRLTELVSSGLETVIDALELSFVDSSGLALLVAGSKLAAENGGSLRVRDPSQPVKRLFEITGLTTLIEPTGA